jgi:hypothetical protein
VEPALPARRPFGARHDPCQATSSGCTKDRIAATTTIPPTITLLFGIAGHGHAADSPPCRGNK